MVQRKIPRHYLLGDLERLLDFAGLGLRRPLFGLGDLDTDRDPDRPLLGGGDLDRLGGGDLLPRGGDLPPRYPRGEGGPRRPPLGGGVLLQLLRLNGGGGPRLPRGDGGLPPRFRGGEGLLTALVVNKNRAVITLPSTCPPSMLMRAFSASSCFSNST